MSTYPDITPFFTGYGKLEPLLDERGIPRKRRWGMFWRIPLSQFTTGRLPLTFHDFDGTAYQPDRHFPTDGGSIPPFMWGIPFLQLNPMAWPRSYPLHDSLFTYGGLYVRRRGETYFKFREIPRVFGDGLLRRMVIADGAGMVDAAAIRLGVLIGSRFAWDEKAQARNRRRDNVAISP